MYHPLPECVTIKRSKIHGFGLFAKSDIPKNTILGISHIYTDIKVFPHNYIRTPLGAFYNHSENPNCRLDDYTDGTMKFLVAVRDISIREELTCKYILYKV